MHAERPDNETLKEVLASYPEWALPTSDPEPLGNAGGLSGARLWRFESRRGRLVARAWPRRGPDRESLGRIHGWLAEAGILGFVPVPLSNREGRSLLERDGRLWEVSPWLPGVADTGRPPDRARLASGFEGLASLHRAWQPHGSQGVSPGMILRAKEIESLLLGGFDELERAIGQSPSDPCGGPALSWLSSARRIAPRLLESTRRAAARKVLLQPCVRDVRADHLLFEGGRLTGLVDYGAMGIDCVAGDLARLISEWVGPDRVARAAALEAYSARRPLDLAESGLIADFDRSTALLIGGRWAAWRFLEHRQFDPPDPVAEGLSRGLDRLAWLVESGAAD